MKITVGVSVRHVHLTNEDDNLLFDEPIKEKVKINQPGQFAAIQKVILKNGERILENVRIIGPQRPYTQVEISRTDAYYLKLNPPVRASGDLKDAEEITIIGPKGEITRKAAIIADRHIHITPEQRKQKKLTKDIYNVKINGEKGGILYNVHIVEKEASYYEMHIDTDDANAHNIKQNDEVEIITD